VSKLDRSILIFIGLGIWTLALNYVFELTNSRADIDSNCKDDQNPCFVSLVTLYKKRWWIIPMGYNGQCRWINLS